MVAIVSIAVILDVQFAYKNRIQPVNKLKPVQAIIVLGAAVLKNGQPSDALADRLDTGINLFKQGLAPTILLTGDNGAYHEDEMDVMKNYIESKGISETNLKIDGQGYRTYESCSRAANIFGIKSAIIVTQNFHLPRALYLCEKFGIDSSGTSADLRHYKEIAWFYLRDWLASAKAFWDINIWHPKPPVSQ